MTLLEDTKTFYIEGLKRGGKSNFIIGITQIILIST